MANGDFIKVSVVVARNDINRMNARAHRKTSQAVRRAGYAIRRFSIPLTRVDTGDLRNRVVLEISNGGHVANLKWLMSYAIYQHDGTKRGVTGTQFAAKGAERAWPVFRDDMSKVFGEGV
jgi:hypothetical protein